MNIKKYLIGGFFILIIGVYFIPPLFEETWPERVPYNPEQAKSMILDITKNYELELVYEKAVQHDLRFPVPVHLIKNSERKKHAVQGNKIISELSSGAFSILPSLEKSDELDELTYYRASQKNCENLPFYLRNGKKVSAKIGDLDSTYDHDNPPAMINMGEKHPIDYEYALRYHKDIKTDRYLKSTKGYELHVLDIPDAKGKLNKLAVFKAEQYFSTDRSRFFRNIDTQVVIFSPSTCEFWGMFEFRPHMFAGYYQSDPAIEHPESICVTVSMESGKYFICGWYGHIRAFSRKTGEMYTEYIQYGLGILKLNSIPISPSDFYYFQVPSSEIYPKEYEKNAWK